jgi:hypothetical protein
MSGDAGAIGGGAFDADCDLVTVVADPCDQVVISQCGGVKLTICEQDSGVGEDGCMVVSACVSIPQ